MTAVTIEVTAEDIANGRRLACKSCPVALAIHRAGYPQAEVLNDNVYPFGAVFGRPVVLATLPLDARVFIANFDARQTVQPFTFTLDIPS